MKNILILEDDKLCNQELNDYTNDLIQSFEDPITDYNIYSAYSLEEALNVDYEVDILILDHYQLAESKGFNSSRNELFSIIKKHHPNCNLLMINPRKDKKTVLKNLESAIMKLMEVKEAVKRITFFI